MHIIFQKRSQQKLQKCIIETGEKILDKKSIENKSTKYPKEDNSSSGSQNCVWFNFNFWNCLKQLVLN